MKENKMIPKALAEKQELQRRQSINLVLRAIEDIKAEHRKVTIATLVEFTGLSRSVFSKGHIRELLVDYGYSEIRAAKCRQKSKQEKMEDVVAEKDRKIQELRTQKKELEKECELLRGNCSYSCSVKQENRYLWFVRAKIYIKIRKNRK